MTEQPQPGRLRRLRSPREPKLPSESEWERSALLVALGGPRRPELVSDGGGLPFPLSALEGPAPALDPSDGAVAVLIAQLAYQAARRREPSASAAERVAGWRELARAQDEVLFGLGSPPRLVTVATRRERREWACVASSTFEPLRAVRGGVRASTWRLDPAQELTPQETILRVLVTEQAFAGGQRADGRVQPPDLFADAGELALTFFVTPRRGFQSGARNPETPVRVQLPHPLGARALRDGAIVV